MLSRRLLRIKVIKALYAHFKSEADSITVSEKNLLSGIDKTYELYHQVLSLVVDVRDLSSRQIEKGKAKMLPTAEDLNPNTRFVDNKAIEQIASSENLNKYLEKHKLGWVKYPELIKRLWKNLSESAEFKAYMEAPAASYKDDKAIVEFFFTNIVNDDELVEEAVEEQSIMWCDDIDFALIMAVRTVQDMKASQADLPLLPQFKSEDDRQFARDLFCRSVINQKEYFEYVGRFTKNWDVERIAFMDNLIMVATMAELLAFPSIPVKVTLDEYIEISKYYSTPGSSNFINGILDKIVEDMKASGRIEKSGRGLLDKTAK